MADDDCSTVVLNIVKARTVWWRMPKILIREGSRLRVSRFFFKSIIQSVLLLMQSLEWLHPTWDGT